MESGIEIYKNQAKQKSPRRRISLCKKIRDELHKWNVTKKLGVCLERRVKRVKRVSGKSSKNDAKKTKDKAILEKNLTQNSVKK